MRITDNYLVKLKSRPELLIRKKPRKKYGWLSLANCNIAMHREKEVGVYFR